MATPQKNCFLWNEISQDAQTSKICLTVKFHYWPYLLQVASDTQWQEFLPP